MNYPVTTEDIKKKPDINNLKDKKKRGKPIPEKTSLIKVPKRILKLHHLITLAIDILFTNNLTFLRKCHDT